MPTISVYLNDENYAIMLSKGKPSAIGKVWIEERIKEEKKEIK